MISKDIGAFEKWSKEDLTVELRSFEYYSSEANEAMCAELSKRGLSDEEIQDIYPHHPIVEGPVLEPDEAKPNTFETADINRTAEGLLLLLSALICLVGPLCLIVSTFNWLKDGVWNPVETVWALKTFDGLQDWLASPDAWFGLHKVIDGVIHLPWAMLSIPTAYILLVNIVRSFEKGK